MKMINLKNGRLLVIVHYSRSSANVVPMRRKKEVDMKVQDEKEKRKKKKKGG